MPLTRGGLKRSLEPSPSRNQNTVPVPDEKIVGKKSRPSDALSQQYGVLHSYKGYNTRAHSRTSASGNFLTKVPSLPACFIDDNRPSSSPSTTAGWKTTPLARAATPGQHHLPGRCLSPDHIKTDEHSHLDVRRRDILMRRYQVMDALGFGTFGRVMAVRDLRKRHTAPEFALKITQNTPDAKDDWTFEKNVLFKLTALDPHGKHHFVRLYNAFIYNGHLCLVLEKLSDTLHKFLRIKTFHALTTDCICTIAYQLCDAVAFLHAKGLTHTDLKPENIVFVVKPTYSDMKVGRRDGHSVYARKLDHVAIRIIDFRSMFSLDDHHGADVTTRQYCVPEVILELGRSFPIIVWSPGCILHEIYTVHLLLRAKTVKDQLGAMEVILEPIPPPMLKRSSVKELVTNGKLVYTEDDAGWMDVQQCARPLKKSVKLFNGFSLMVWSVGFICFAGLPTAGGTSDIWNTVRSLALPGILVAIFLALLALAVAVVLFWLDKCHFGRIRSKFVVVNRWHSDIHVTLHPVFRSSIDVRGVYGDSWKRAGPLPPKRFLRRQILGSCLKPLELLVLDASYIPQREPSFTVIFPDNTGNRNCHASFSQSRLYYDIRDGYVDCERFVERIMAMPGNGLGQIFDRRFRQEGLRARLSSIIVESLAHSAPSASHPNSLSGLADSQVETKRPTYYGMTGLNNLGNSCYLSSAVQCLANTREFRDYFLTGKYKLEINHQNTMGTKGRFAAIMEETLRALWRGDRMSISPSALRDFMAERNDQFSTYGQQDAQEAVTFIIDSLHEDLNRVTVKPYLSDIESDNRPDSEVAEQTWKYYSSRENSAIYDLFSGMFKSTVECLACHKKRDWNYHKAACEVSKGPSIGLPFVISLRAKQLTYEAFYMNVAKAALNSVSYRRAEPGPRTSTKPKENFTEVNGEYCQSSAEADATTCSKESSVEDEKACLDEATEEVNLEPATKRILVEWNVAESFKAMIGPSKKNTYPFKLLAFDNSRTPIIYPRYSTEMKTAAAVEETIKRADEFILLWNNSPMDEPLLTEQKEIIYEEDDYCRTVPVLNERERQRSATQEGVQLEDCISLLTNPEILSQSNAWICPRCKVRRDSSKKLEIWSLPSVLVLQLKRFSKPSGEMFRRDKIETLVDYPLDSLQMSDFLVGPADGQPYVYDLYGAVVHRGSTWYGHYVSYARCYNVPDTCNSDVPWRFFDDESVEFERDGRRVVNRGAYLLFYRQRGTPSPVSLPLRDSHEEDPAPGEGVKG